MNPSRGLFDRIIGQKLTSKKAKRVVSFLVQMKADLSLIRFLFKKWLAVETRIGDAAGQEKAKERAREWVAANSKAAEGSEDQDD